MNEVKVYRGRGVSVQFNAARCIHSAELTVKLDEVDRANADLRNIYESTQIASVFLDGDLVIRQFDTG